VYEEFVFSTISPSKKGRPPSSIINFSEDLQIPVNSVPRFEMFRGTEGDIVINMNGYSGIRDLGDKIEVKAGTTWKEVLKDYNVEVYGNLDFTVGGTLFFDDPIFGMNEFSSFSNKVEVEAINRSVYHGKYTGGIPVKVIIKKENKNLIWKEWKGNISSLISRIKSWYSNRVPVFRDVSLVKDKEGVRILASYPEAREILVKPFMEGSETSVPFYDKIYSRLYYEGELPFESISLLESALEVAEFAVVRVRRDKVAFSISSMNKIVGLPGVKYSIEDSLFNGCVLCGACVSVCPHGEQRGNNIAFTPLGFYVMQSDGMGSKVANCHLCGNCMSQCPVKLDIVGDLRKFIVPMYKQINTKLEINELRKNINIVITPISIDLYQYALRALSFLSDKGLDVGLMYLNVNVNSLIKGDPDLDFLNNELAGVTDLITLTPEDHYYLQILKAKRVIQIEFLGNMLLKEFPELTKGKSVHIPCLLKNHPPMEHEIGKCSTVFLDKVNGEGTTDKLKADITLCPLTSISLGIPSILDIALPQLPDLNSVIKQIQENITKSSENTREILDDLTWFDGLNEGLVQDFKEKIIKSSFKNVPQSSLKLIYIYSPILQHNPENYKIIEEIKNAIAK